MLAIDVTLRTIDAVAFVADNVSALGVDFSGLQTAYISIKSPECAAISSSSNSRNLDSLTNINTGRGSFAIIGESSKIMKDIYDSTASVKVSVLGGSNGSPLSEYASGILENIHLRDHTSKDIVDCVSDKILSQKVDVYGGTAIIAFYPEIVVDLIHSVGVGSSAGTVTISITIIDISKASKSKVIGATGRIVQDLNSTMDKEKKHTENNEGCSFDMEGFLNQKKTPEILVEENSSEDDSEILSECPTITPIVDDKYELSDSEESVSIDNFLISLREKRETMEKNQINSDTTLPPTMQKDFKYNIIERTSREKFIPSGLRGSMILRNGGDDVGDWPPIAVTQNGTRVLGVQRQGHVQEERQRRKLRQKGGLNTSLAESISKNINGSCNEKSMKAYSNRNGREIKDNKKNISSSDFWLSNAINDTICMKKKSEKKNMTENAVNSFPEMERDLYCAEPDALDGILLLASEQKLQSSNIGIIISNSEDKNFLIYKKTEEDQKEDPNRKGVKKKKSSKKKEISNKTNKSFVDNINIECNQNLSDKSIELGNLRANKSVVPDYDESLDLGHNALDTYKSVVPVYVETVALDTDKSVVVAYDETVLPDSDKPVIPEQDDLLDTETGSIQLGLAEITDTRSLSSSSTPTSTSTSTARTEQEIRTIDMVVESGVLDSMVREKRQSRIIPKVFSFQF